MKIGVYGGSFNPPHTGHKMLAEEALRRLGLDRLILVPSGRPPHKEMPADTPPARQRLELLRRTAGGVPNVEISEIELKKDAVSYSCDTLRAISEQHPGSGLVFLMGSDQFESFLQWREPKTICALAEIAVFFRSDSDKSDIARFRALKEELERRFGAKVSLVDNDFVEISSSALRRMIIFGCGGDWMSEAAYEYVLEKRLYGTGVDRKNLPYPELRREAFALLESRRIPHVEGCEETAAALALRWGADVEAAKRAALLHDITKALNCRQQLILCKKYGIITGDVDINSPDTLHARTAEAVAREIFGESEEVCAAIGAHTTGRPGMDLLSRIICLADCIEPTRSYEGVEQLRSLAREDLDRALLTALELTLKKLERDGSAVHPMTLLTLDYLRQHSRTPGGV